MMKTISISIPEEKLTAIDMHLQVKNTSLQAELEKFVEQTYLKTVPQSVRDYIDLISVQKPKKAMRKPRQVQSSESEAE